MYKKVSLLSNTSFPDVTERKRMEEALRENEEKLQRMFDSVSEGITVTDLNGVITEANEKAAEMHGFSSSKEILGKSALDFIHPSEHEKAMGNMKRTLKHGVSGTIEYRLIKTDGSEFPGELSASVLKDASGNPVGSIAITRGITERKRAEEELRSLSERESKSAREWQELFDASIDVIALISPDYEILRINRAGYEGIGKKREELIGKKCYEVVHGLHSQIDGCPCKELIRTKKAGVGEITQWGRHYIATASPILDKNGELQAFAHTIKDITERKRVEESIRQSEEKYRNLVDNSNDIVNSTDKSGNWTFLSPSVTRILGYEPAEMLGKSAFSFMHPGDVESTREAHERMVREGMDVWQFENRYIHKDGRIITLAWNGIAVRDEMGNIIGTYGIGRDITERKRMDEALKSSEERLKILFEFAPDAYYLNDLKGNFIDGNKAAEEITGYERDELIGKSFLKLKLLPPGQTPKAAALLAKNVLGQSTGPGEFTLNRKDGTQVQVEIRTFPVKIEGKTLVLGIARDITERKRVEEEMRAKDSAIASSINAIAMADLEGNLTYVNDSFLKMWGHENDNEVLGKQAVQFWQSEDNALEAMKALEEKGGWVGELVAKRKDGSFFDTQVSTSIVVDETGKPIRRMASFIDITERKRMEQEIKDKNEQLEAANEKLRAANEELGETQEQLIRSEKLAAIGKLAGGVGHELRNPLGAIKNAVYYIKGKVSKSELGQKEPRVIEFLDVMDDEINASNKIISDLLGFSRVQKPSVSPTRIGKVIEDAASHTPIPENIELIKKLDAGLPEVEIDPDQIHQVFVNMITNAVQAMPEGGKLTIDTRAKGGFLEVEVADTGGGIPEESVDKIFDPLFTTKAEGIGLGLAACKAIIDRHEGNIEVKSKVGKGTTFTVSLPSQ